MRFFRNRLRRQGPEKGAKHEIYWLTSDLAFSAEPSTAGWSAIVEAGIQIVVDLRAEADSSEQAAASNGLSYRRLPIVDGCAPDDDELALLTDWIVERIESDGAVLVHCREGRGRSALVACATLVRLGFPLSLAYRTLHQVRPTIVLSDEQAEALWRYADSRGRAS